MVHFYFQGYALILPTNIRGIIGVSLRSLKHPVSCGGQTTMSVPRASVKFKCPPSRQQRC
jgi:hypothetical protein